MATSLKKLALRLGKTVVVLVIAAGLFLGYVVYSEHTAMERAAQFCRPIAAGFPTDGLADRAISLGAENRFTKWLRDADSLDQLPVTFSGATKLSRHICWITAKNGRVVSSQVVYLD
jgi:hypothetical protein